MNSFWGKGANEFMFTWTTAFSDWAFVLNGSLDFSQKSESLTNNQNFLFSWIFQGAKNTIYVLPESFSFWKAKGNIQIKFLELILGDLIWKWSFIPLQKYLPTNFFWGFSNFPNIFSWGIFQEQLFSDFLVNNFGVEYLSGNVAIASDRKRKFEDILLEKKQNLIFLTWSFDGEVLILNFSLKEDRHVSLEIAKKKEGLSIFWVVWNKTFDMTCFPNDSEIFVKWIIKKSEIGSDVFSFRVNVMRTAFSDPILLPSKAIDIKRHLQELNLGF